MVLRSFTDKIDPTKQSNSIVPNYIHSFDASLIVKLILRLKQEDVITIHDCFGCHPNHMKALRLHIINSFVDMYFDQDYLFEFHQANLDLIKNYHYEIYEEPNSDNLFVITPNTQPRPIPKPPQMQSTHYLKDLIFKNLNHIYMVR